MNQKDMKKCLLLAVLMLINTTLLSQDYNAIAKKIHTITKADAEFTNVKSSVFTPMDSKNGRVEIAEGLVKFKNAEVKTFSPNISSNKEWLYHIAFESSPTAKRDFFQLVKSINTQLLKDGYKLKKEGQYTMSYQHTSKPLVTLSMVENNGSSNIECMVIQNKNYYENPNNTNQYFNHIVKASTTFRMSTSLGNTYVKSTPLLRLNQEQYSINFEKLKRTKGTPTENCATSRIIMYLNRNSNNYWFATSCFADAFYTIKGDKLVLTKYSNRNAKIDPQALANQQKGVPLPKNGFDAQRKAIQLYAELLKESATIKPKKTTPYKKERPKPKKEIKKSNPIDVSFKYAVSFTNDLALVRYGDKNGFINASGKQVIPAIYDNANSFTEGLASVRKDNKWGFIDPKGTVIIPLDYETTMSFSEGFAGAKKNGKWGFIDQTRKTIVPFEYEFVFSFSDGLAGARKDGKWGFIDTSGKVVIPFEYKRAYSFSGGIASVGKDGKVGIINTKGELVVPLSFSSTYAPTDGYCIAKLNGKYGMVNSNGKTIIPFQYDGLSYFYEGLAQIKKGGLYGFVNMQGQEVIKPTYKKAGYPSDGLILVRKDDAWAYINTQGKLAFTVKYQGARDFEEGLARVYNNGKYGFIDTSGKEVIPLIYDYANYNFSNGLIVVAEKGVVKVLKNPVKN
jgi:hypothetical protein